MPTLDLKDRFLSTFQGDTRNNILAFCKILWEDDSDIFIFMARKAACFFDCLKELRLADVRGLALSDRVLDMDLSLFEGKSVTLVDDCIFSGTTLFNAKTVIMDAGCKSLCTRTLAVNIDSIRPELLPGGAEADRLSIAKPLFRGRNSECVRQCYDIVRAISVVPRPYDVDFPHPRTFKTVSNKLDLLLKLPGWTAFDVSSDFQKQHGVRAFTLVPTQPVLEQFCEERSGNRGSVSALKIRVYARETKNGYRIRLVPIAMLPHLTDGEVVGALVSDYVTRDILEDTCRLVTPSSRYRFLHFLTSHSLLAYFREVASGALEISLELRRDLMEMAFGFGAGAWYEELWPEKAARLPLVGSKQHSSSVRVPEYRRAPITVELPSALASEGIAPFTWLYKQRELSARSDVKRDGLERRNTSPLGHLNRLNEGFSPQELLSRLQSSTLDTQRYLTLQLDRLIDLGVSVPTVVLGDCGCYRAFRHGEDAILGEAQERLILSALRSYMQAREVEAVWGLELQKLVVLVVQIAIRNGLMDRVNVVPSVPLSCRIVSVKGHLHGPVATTSSAADPSGSIGVPFVAGSSHNPHWLVDDWVSKKYLSRTRRTQGTQYAITDMPTLSLGERSEAQSRQIGRSIGQACRKGIINVDRDLVMLSTCAEPDHQLRALAGEIAIFRDRWPHLSQRIVRHVEIGRYVDAHQDLRGFRDVFTAVNSGARKYRWFANAQFAATVKSVASDLRKSGLEEAADTWVLLWPSTQPFENQGDTFEWDTLSKCGRWLLGLNLAMRVVDYWLIIHGRRRGQLEQVDLAEFESDLRLRLAELQQPYRDRRFPKFLRLSKSSIHSLERLSAHELEGWYQEAQRILGLFARQNSRHLLDNIISICGAYGAVDEVCNYPYAIFFDTPVSSGFQSAPLYRALEESLLEVSRTDTQRYYHLLDRHNPWRTGRWTVLTGNHQSTDAVRVCARTCVRLRSLGIPFKAAVIGQLSSNNRIRAFSFSTEIASGFFLVRIAQLRQALMPDEFDNSVTLATEMSYRGASEASKFSEVVGSRKETTQAEIILEETNELPAARFEVVRFFDPYSSGVYSRASRRVDPQRSSDLKILICTATDTEDDMMADFLAAEGLRYRPETRKHISYQDLGQIGNASVSWIRSGMGSGGSDGSSLVVADALEELKPDYVIACGVAFGSDPAKQELGDVLVSTWVRSYEQGRQEPDRFLPRGHKTPASSQLLQAARSTRLDLRSMRVTEGGLLSGDKLVDSRAFKRKLWEIEPEAIGGEMEATGIIGACQRRQVGWLVVKAICDWGESKNSRAQPQAAANSVKFVYHMISGRRIPSG